MAALSHTTPKRRALLGAAFTAPLLPLHVTLAAPQTDARLIALCDRWVASSERSDALYARYADRKGFYSVTAEENALLEDEHDLQSTLEDAILATPATTHEGRAAKARMLRHDLALDYEGAVQEEDRLLASLLNDVIRAAGA